MSPTSSKEFSIPHDVTALILAAGSGQRLGGRAKAFIGFHEDSLLHHALEVVEPWVSRVIVGVRQEDLERGEQECRKSRISDRVTCIAGGATRQESLRKLLEASTGEYLIIHEVARPWVGPEDFRNLLREVQSHGAVSLYTKVPTRDSVALMENGKLGEILPRSSLIALQTPHAYQRSVLKDAYDKALQNGWSEDSTAALVKKAGHAVHLIEGSERNVKVTYPEDLAALESPLPKVLQSESGAPHSAALA